MQMIKMSCSGVLYTQTHLLIYSRGCSKISKHLKQNLDFLLQWEIFYQQPTASILMRVFLRCIAFAEIYSTSEKNLSISVNNRQKVLTGCTLHLQLLIAYNLCNKDWKNLFLRFDWTFGVKNWTHKRHNLLVRMRHHTLTRSDAKYVNIYVFTLRS